MTTIRFTKGGAYSTDIDKLRDKIRANGTLAKAEALEIQHSTSTKKIYFWMNLAYEANASKPTPSASLYIVGFSLVSTGPTYVFDVKPMPSGVPNPINIKGNPDGSYSSLGYPTDPFPTITDANLKASIETLAGSTPNTSFGKNEKDAMTRLIIATSEAVRFNSEKTGVNGVLGNTTSFVADWNQIHNWNGHSLG